MGDYQQYHYEMFDLDPEHPLKIISQPLYNHAAEHGFPPDFFTNSYFDHVDFGHIPEGVDCSCSQFISCTFRGPIMKCVFDDAAIYDSNFERAVLRMVNFTRASIAHTRFRHSGLSFVSFLDARLKGGYMRDCSFDIVDFKGATIDGTWFHCTEARRVLNLYHASITQGGATHEEADKFRVSVFRALRVYPYPVKLRPPAPRRRKGCIPER